MTEAATWARALAVLAVAWVIVKAGDLIGDLGAALTERRARRRLHRSIVGAYATRRRYGTNPRFDEAIRTGEDAWLQFPTNQQEET